MGTQTGVSIGPSDGSSQLKLVLSLPFVQQITVLDDKLIVFSGAHNSQLVAHGIHSLLCLSNSKDNPAQDWCMIKRSMVICFTTGKVRNQSVIVYLTQEQDDIWLVVIVPTAGQSHHWFKKYKMVKNILFFFFF
jgi:hypothetical protein